MLISLGFLPNLYQLNKCLVLLSSHVINLYLHNSIRKWKRKETAGKRKSKKQNKTKKQIQLKFNKENIKKKQLLPFLPLLSLSAQVGISKLRALCEINITVFMIKNEFYMSQRGQTKLNSQRVMTSPHILIYQLHHLKHKIMNPEKTNKQKKPHPLKNKNISFLILFKTKIKFQNFCEE